MFFLLMIFVEINFSFSSMVQILCEELVLLFKDYTCLVRIKIKSMFCLLRVLGWGRVLRNGVEVLGVIRKVGSYIFWELSDIR